MASRKLFTWSRLAASEFEERPHDRGREEQHGEERQYPVEREPGSKEQDVVLFQLSPDQPTHSNTVLKLPDGDLRGPDDEFYHQAA